jgi:hypothetical protein
MNRGREKAGAGVQGPHPLDKILGEKRRASSSNNYARARARARAHFLGVQRCKNHKKAAERIDEANYVRVFFLGYEKPKDARRLKLPPIGRFSACKAGTDLHHLGSPLSFPNRWSTLRARTPTLSH